LLYLGDKWAIPSSNSRPSRHGNMVAAAGPRLFLATTSKPFDNDSKTPDAARDLAAGAPSRPSTGI
jgi:hypothetical protein